MNGTHPLCHICKTQSVFFMNKDGFDEYVCPSCHLSFVFPQPSADELKEKVYSYESGYQGNRNEDISVVLENKRSATILDFLAREKPKGSLLDVGCSNGQFMFWANKRGLSSSGVEINRRTADVARKNGFEVYGGFLETAPFKKESFDIVFLGDVIEHVNDPRALMETCRGFLKKGGLLVISTPNVDCFWSKSTFLLYRLFRIPWSSLTPPHHLFQFSESNLTTLLSQSGFEKEKEWYVSPGRLMYELGSLHLLKRYKKNKTIGFLLYTGFAYGLYTIVFGVNRMIAPFGGKDFGLTAVYKKI